MGEEIKVKELICKGRAFYRLSTVLTINQEFSEDDKRILCNRVLKIAKDNGEDRFLSVNILTAKEYYLYQLNSVLYGGFTDRKDYPSYFDQKDIDFVDSLFERFINNSGIYFPGTVIVCDVFNSINSTLGIIKNEIINNSWKCE